MDLHAFEQSRDSSNECDAERNCSIAKVPWTKLENRLHPCGSPIFLSSNESSLTTSGFSDIDIMKLFGVPVVVVELCLIVAPSCKSPAGCALHFAVRASGRV